MAKFVARNAKAMIVPVQLLPEKIGRLALVTLVSIGSCMASA